jgi:tetratricopeptide (TPR) repeat protein
MRRDMAGWIMLRALVFGLLLALTPSALQARDLATYKARGEKLFESDTKAAVSAYENARAVSPNDADVLHKLVTLYLRQGLPIVAEPLARQLAGSADADTRARGLLDLGNVNDALGNFNAAIGNHNQALKLAVAEKLPRREAEALGNLASIDLAFGRREDAEALLKRALALDEKNGDLKGYADDLGNLGYIALDRGQLDTATGYFNRALALDKQVGRFEGQAYDYNALGLVAWEKDDKATACENFLHAYEITRRIGAEKSYIGVRAHEDLQRCPPVS